MKEKEQIKSKVYNFTFNTFPTSMRTKNVIQENSIDLEKFL